MATDVKKTLFQLSIVVCIFVFIFMINEIRTRTPLPSNEFPSFVPLASIKNWSSFPKRNLSDRHGFQDLNCVYTLPKALYDSTGNMPIIIPNDLDMPLDILSCLYHRYVSTLQALCIYPKLVGLADDHGGYVCVDGDLIPENNCKVHIFGKGVDQMYSDQLKTQYKCTVKWESEENGTADNVVSSNLFRSLRKWITKHQNENTAIHVLFLTVSENPNDIYIVNELLLSKLLISRIRQISLKIYYKPETASSVGYKQRLLIFRKLYELNFRIFFYNQEVECKPANIGLSKYLSCYSVYLKKVDSMPEQPMQLSENQIQKQTGKGILRLYDRYLGSIQVLCKEIIRVGNIKSGGWNVCHDIRYRPASPCLVYSFGINVDWTFDEDIVETYGCEVYSFDPSINRRDYQHSDRVFYYNIGIHGKDMQQNNWKLRSLGTIMKMLGHSNRVLDILKLDVEGAEWPALINMIETGILSKVRQLYIEFHNNPNAKNLEIIKKLNDKGFKIFFTHKNLAKPCKVSIDGGFASTCVEVYFLNTQFQNS